MHDLMLDWNWINNTTDWILPEGNLNLVFRDRFYHR